MALYFYFSTKVIEETQIDSNPNVPVPEKDLKQMKNQRINYQNTRTLDLVGL